MSISDRHISAELLAKFLEQQDEDALKTYMFEEHPPFPYSIHHYETGEYFPLIRDYLDPDDDPTSLLWHVVEGMHPVIRDGLPPDNIYLGQVRYLSPAEVQTIARQMLEITPRKGIKRYMDWRHIDNEDLVWEEDPSDYTGYRFVWSLFQDMLCFFRIAEEAGDGILRCQTDY